MFPTRRLPMKKIKSIEQTERILEQFFWLVLHAQVAIAKNAHLLYTFFHMRMSFFGRACNILKFYADLRLVRGSSVRPKNLN